jgi:hypothetical protein
MKIHKSKSQTTMVLSSFSVGENCPTLSVACGKVHFKDDFGGRVALRKGAALAVSSL